MRRLYRFALRLTPPHVRALYGADMAETFDALYDDAARRGAAAVSVLIAREVLAGARSRVQSWPRVGDTMRHLFLGLTRPSAISQTVRALRRRPAFALAGVLTLAAGTAATTLTFSVVDTVLLKPLPYPAPDRIVTLFENMPSRTNRVSLVAPARLADWAARTHTFDAIAGTYVESPTDTSGAEPVRLESRNVTPGYFDVMGVAPLIGRTFQPEEEAFGGPEVALISESLWTRRFQRSNSALGARLVLGGDPVTIVGVMPKSFAAESIDLWRPATLPPALGRQREARFLSGVGRLKADVTYAQAADDLAAVQAQLGDEFPASDRGWAVRMASLRDERVGATGRTLWMVFGAVLLLWLIGLANLAGLNLVQLRRRQRELAIRSALGASRAQVIAGVAAETIVLVTAASAIGIAAAAASIRFVPRVFDALPRLNELQLDGRAIAVAIGTSLVAALLVGVWPVLSATRGRVTRHGLAGRGTTAGAHGLQRALVVVQVALSLLLAGAAALLGRSYYNLTAVPSGFDSASVWTFHVGAQWNEDRQLVGLMQERIVGDLATVPGVEAAGLVNFLPMSRATLRSPVLVAGVTGPERDGSMNAGSRVVSDGYFRALRVPIEAGENCPSLRMDFDAPRRVLINRRFADDYAPGQSLVGREMRVVQDPGAPYTIVGIVNDMAEDDIDGRTSPYIYTCDSAGSWPDPEYVVRTSDPSGLAGALREVVRRHAPSRAIFDLAPLDDVTAKLRQTPRLNAAMLALFSSAALVLASIGLYSLFTLLVAEQVREIGVRLALGATPSQMIGLVASSAGKLLAGGLVIGGALIVALQRFIVTQLFGVSPLDPWSLTMAALVLGAVSLAAVLLPAARAGRVSPMVAMTAE